MTTMSVVSDKDVSNLNIVAPLAVLSNEAVSHNPEAAAKIVPIESIGKVLESLRSNGKVVQCHGVFDLLHIGHIKHLNHAKSVGDILVVSITADKYVKKGPGKPYFNERLRAEKHWLRSRALIMWSTIMTPLPSMPLMLSAQTFT